MRKLLLIGITIAAVSAVTSAQRHVNDYEIPVKGSLAVSSDVMLGTATLREGVYNYRCDRHFITFVSDKTGRTVLKVPCEGRELPAPVEETVMHTKTDATGRKVVTKLLLKGSNIEHVFR
jgi:hypothetical protein